MAKQKDSAEIRAFVDSVKNSVEGASAAMGTAVKRLELDVAKIFQSQPGDKTLAASLDEQIAKAMEDALQNMKTAKEHVDTAKDQVQQAQNNMKQGR